MMNLPSDPPSFHSQDMTWLLADVTALLRDAVAAAYDSVPVLVIALACGIILPVLALLGYTLPRRRIGVAPDAGSGTPARSSRLGRAATVAAEDPDAVDAEPGAFALVREGGAEGEPVWDALRIGAGDDCNVRLDEAGVEDLHAVVLRDPVRGVEIVRLASDGGSDIYVDGEAVLRRVLRGGETIRIGHNVFSFRPHNGWESAPDAAVT